jgi:hypothetical protein
MLLLLLHGNWNTCYSMFATCFDPAGSLLGKYVWNVHSYWIVLLMWIHISGHKYININVITILVLLIIWVLALKCKTYNSDGKKLKVKIELKLLTVYDDVSRSRGVFMESALFLIMCTWK